MKAVRSPLFVAALLGTGFVVGDPVEICPSGAGGVCYSIAVPTSSANANSGNIYFQIRAPTSFEWVALGTGVAMAGSNIFVMYQDGRGNVTVSPRQGAGNFMPTQDTSSTAARLTVLAGSGVSSDGSTMTANVACSNCQTWGGGEMSLKSTSAGWIAAWRAGSALRTTDLAADIAVHDRHAQFRVDLTRATISSDSNPFTTTRNAGGSSGSNSGSDSDSGSNSGSGVIQTTSASRSAILVAHGIIMSLVMAALYPLGSLLMPLFRKWWVHGSWQAVAFCLMWAGFGLGVTTAQERRMLFQEKHTIIGTLVVCLMAIQPVLGLLHHRHYLKTKSRGLISYAHIWWGRTLMVLGVINGGLGLQLARERNELVIAYSVIAGIIFGAYLGYKLLTFLRGDRSAARSESKESNGHLPRTPSQ